MPAADQILFNRHYVIGYSYYFRQAKWALEIVDPDMTDIERADNFPFRLPRSSQCSGRTWRITRIRDLTAGHLVASANQREVAIQNSETFLLSNMSPQHPDLNRKIWKNLEEAVRELNAKSNIYETYVICGPIFDFNKTR